MNSAWGRRLRTGNFNARRIQLIEGLEPRWLLTAVSVGDVTVVEGSGGTTAAQVSVKLFQSEGQTVAVNYFTSDSSAVVGADYTPASGTLIFGPGETSKTIGIAVNPDTIQEDAEGFFVNLNNVVNADIVGPAGKVLIVDDDTSYLTTAEVGVTEGDAGTTNEVFTVTRSGSLAGTSSVFYSTADSSAVAFQDYLPTAGALVFAPGESTKTVSVPVIGDTNFENDEVFRLTLGGQVNTTLLINNVGGYIADDDATYFTVASTSVNEGDGPGTASFTVTRTGKTTGASLVNYATGNGNAVALQDYLPVAGTLSFAPGETSKTVNVPIVGDTTVENFESFAFFLGSPINGTILDNFAQGYITDDDASFIGVTAPTLLEGNADSTNAVFTVTRVGKTTGTATMDFITANESAASGSDFTEISGSLTFAPGETTKRVNVAVLGDTTVEGNETFRLRLSNLTNAAFITGDSAAATIVNDDAALTAPVFSIDDVVLNEGSGAARAATLTVTRLGPSANAASVTYATQDFSAQAPTDYASTSGTLNFAANETSKTITVNVVADTLAESNELFLVNLSGAVGGTIAKSQGAAYIADDDTSVIFIGDAYAAEGDAGETTFTFPLIRTGSLAGTSTFSYGTFNGSAQGGSDFDPAVGTITFGPNEATKNVTVQVNGDTLQEDNESFGVSLSNFNNVSSTGRNGEAIIVNDDSTAVILSDVAGVEGDSGTSDFGFNLVRVGETNSQVAVTYTTQDNSAQTPGDYQATSATVVFAPGETTKTLTVPVVGDTLQENAEAFYMRLTNVDNARVLADVFGQGTIIDRDASFISIDDVTVAEGTPAAVFTVRRLGSTAGETTVMFSTGNGSATAASDYEATVGTLTFAPDETSKTISVPILNDAMKEGAESFYVTLANAGNASIIGGNGTGQGTILDDDVSARVTGVFVNGSTWTNGFRSFVQSQGMGSSNGGYFIPDGLAQLGDLPWANANQISLRFNTVVNIKQDDLTVRGVTVANYASTSFAYDPATGLATWTLGRSLPNDALMLELNSAAVTDGSGQALDGEWTNGSDAFPSGDGQPGGLFRFRANALPGDVNQSGGAVSASDLVLSRNRIGRSTANPGAGPTAFSVFNDVNGDGTINASDLVLVRNNIGKAAPSGLRGADLFADRKIVGAVGSLEEDATAL